MKTLDVAIVGAGIAGTAGALLLRRQGHRVTLFERTDRIGPVGAGFLLQRSGQEVIERLGLLGACEERSERIDALRAVTMSGRTMSLLRYADFPEPGVHALGVHRAHLFEVIHAMLAPAGVDVRLGVDVTAYKRIGRRVDLLAGQRSLGTFDMVVVADGARSRLRHQSGLCRWNHEYDDAAVWGVGPCDGVRNMLYQRTRGTRILCGILPIGRGLATFFWGLPKRDWPALQKRGFNRWRDEVIACEPLTAPIVESFRSFADLTYTTFRHVEMSAWHDGPVVFVGDAAHATSPHLGQGVNLALTDVEALACALEMADTVDDGLDRYEDDRRAMQRYYSTLTRTLSPLFQSDGWMLGALRDIGLPILCKLPPTRWLMLHTLAGTWQRTRLATRC